jgi:hypothetical protein
LLLPLLASAIFPGLSGPVSSPAAVTAAFAQLQSLAGDWEGKEGDGNTTRTSFKRVISNTAVLETLSRSDAEEMMTLYSIDTDGIALVHYCPINNQPRIGAIPLDGEIKELVFLFQSAGNLPDPAVGHEQKLIIQFADKDHITELWTWRMNRKDTRMVYRFVRKSGAWPSRSRMGNERSPEARDKLVHKLAARPTAVPPDSTDADDNPLLR